MRVLLRGGVYPITKPVCFDARDSGDTTYAACEGQTPVLDGGATIRDWTVVTVNGVQAWRADVSGLLGQLSHVPRSLFVDGQRAERPRLPREGFWQSHGTVGSPESFTLYAGSNRVRMPEGCIDPHWRNLTDIDLRVLHLWVDERMPITAYDAHTRTVTSSHRSIMMLSGKADGWTAERVFVENVFEAMTQPGQWYLDRREGAIYYVPRPGQTPDRTRCILPMTLGFLRLEGDPLRDAWVQGLRFVGLTFRHSDWVQPANDWHRRFDPYRDPPTWHPRDSFTHFAVHDRIDPAQSYASVPQAAHNVPGAVHLFGARDCTLDRCTIEHAGFYAIELGDGCSNVTVADCTLRDLGGGGVNIDGGNLGSDPRRYTHTNVIRDNRIHCAGRVFHAACGILLCHGFDHHIAGNHIHDLYYSGISVGWEWTRALHISRGNIVENNHIHHIGGPSGLSDLGGIYTLGIQPGTVLRGNTIHDIASHAYGGWGIYTDAGSAHIIIEYNRIYDTASQCINVNTGNCEILLRHNTLISTDLGAVNIARRPKDWTGLLHFTRACTLIGNTIVTHGGPAFTMRAHEGGELADYVRAVLSDGNTFVDSASPAAPVLLADWRGNHLMTFQAWRATGNDQCSRLSSVARAVPSATHDGQPLVA